MEVILKKLQNSLLTKFRERGGFGEDIGQWKNSTYIELSADIERFLDQKLDEKNRNRLGINVSVSTLKRFLSDQYLISSPLDPRKKTVLDKICIYSGYQNYQKFIDAQEKEQIVEQPKQRTAQQKNSPRKRSLTYFLLLPLAVLLGVLFFVSQKDNPPPPPPPPPPVPNRDSIQTLKVVKNAVEAEFAAYKAVPSFETQLDTLKSLFWEDGAAYKSIFHVINAQKLKACILSNDANPSSNELLNITLDSIDHNTAYVSTKEHWRLKWFDTKAYRYEYLYDTINIQNYVLTKNSVNSLWKIAINNYAGHKHKYPQRYIDCQMVADKTLSLTSVKKEVNTAVKNGGTTLALKILECFFDNTNQNNNQVTVLSMKLKDLYKDLNTGKISYQFFTNQKQDMSLEVLSILE